jgi:hypothetical protein
MNRRAMTPFPINLNNVELNYLMGKKILLLFNLMGFVFCDRTLDVTC